MYDSYAFAIVRLPANGARKTAQCRVSGEKKKVDEMAETLHTLPSSQLTNKTLCQGFKARLQA
ncbi:hypothetical protein, partial [Rugamonas violacea]|uniref:hypothetical protein n=1 Tax=Rugamonas sp. CCM 8940 TaxID=2765359 RepID=UPI001F2B1849